MKKYHLRRQEREIKSPNELLSIIRRQKYLTLAMCWNREPYLVSLNYGFDSRRRFFYFHCSPRGKKIDFLKHNPVVWGQIVEDRGYVAGHCDHNYRTVQFRGRVSFLARPSAKRRALRLMIRQLEPKPGRLLRSLDQPRRIAKVTIGRIACGAMSGKRSAPVKSVLTPEG